MQLEHARAQLGAVPLFAALEKDVLESILQRVALVTLSDGEILFQQHQPANRIFMLSTGQIKLALTARHGGEKIISLIQPGNTFAEAVLFSSQRRYPVSASSIGGSAVWEIDGEHFIGVLQGSNSACFAVIRCVTERLHQQLGEIERLTLHTATYRLITHLLSQIDPVDADATESVVIRLGAPKHVIASRLSIVPETFSRSLSKLVRDGLIEVREDEVTLLNVARLRSFSDDFMV